MQQCDDGMLLRCGDVAMFYLEEGELDVHQAEVGHR